MKPNDPRHDPSWDVPAEGRRVFRPIGPYAIVFLAWVICAAGYFAYAAWDFHSKQSVRGSCHSECLSHLGMHLRHYASEHDNQLPPADQLLSVASGELGHILGCEHAKLPYQWDFRLAGKRLDEIDGRALAWCPPGGHGNYVGVIVAEEGKLRTRVLTIAELQSLVGDYQVK
jgi:hypothetical protein